MSPWVWKCWRLAWTEFGDMRQGEMSSGGGNVWRRVVFGLWWRTS